MSQERLESLLFLFVEQEMTKSVDFNNVIEEFKVLIFILCLKLTSSVNGEPGIFTEVMETLKTLKTEDKHCNLCMDAMALRKQILWSDKFNKFIGYCDFGGEVQLEGLDVPATEALVFIAITQAELVKTILNHTHQAGLTVWGITCDGAYTNSAMMKILGCKTGNNYNDVGFLIL
ncbi:Dimer Tnp hAT domain-containing protein [Aphis craccivora]|uniref:Dimer Tnp hAT domain-containing protein n=1 Tax=Aphis craccivora TaxID=307492 RepID=A0A6G0YBC9_APHCR|nr:Dimer Tnp hAT domain-containing protein [Aphis craccivora]